MDIEALKELLETKVDKFISLWSSKAFREDYERRILPSLDFRQLSRDGWMRNPEEKPLVVVEAVPSVLTDVVPKTIVKQPKEESSSSKPDATSVQKVQKEKSTKQQKETIDKIEESTMNPVDLLDGEEFFVPEKKQKDPPPKVNEIDELKLKGIKGEEEIAKAKQAMERKKKLSEKAAAKAAIKAQKEAEKKLKDREKRAKKKAGASVIVQEPEEQTEAAAAEAAEPEKVEETVETPVPPKNKDWKETAIRHRNCSKGAVSLPKALLKLKKSTNYWIWAAPAALVELLLIAVGYNYLL